jgi:hypothetical protein
MRVKTCVLVTLAAATMMTAGCQQATITGPGDRELSMEFPAYVTIQRGSSERMEVEIHRTATREPVTVSISNLPDGVTAKQTRQTVETNEVTFMLEADRNAALVSNQAVSITLTGRQDDQSVTEHFKLTVSD